MNPQEQHRFEQSLASSGNILPRIWYTYYIGCLDAGFTESQSFNLVQTYILSQCSSGIRPSDAGGSDKKEAE